MPKYNHMIEPYRFLRLRLSLLLPGVSLRDLRREDGQTLVEYGLILALVAVVLVVAVTTFGGKVKGLFSSVSSNL